MADFDRLLAMEQAKLEKSSKIEAPYWLEPLASAIQNIPIQREKVRMYRKNDLNDQAASLENLAKLVTDENSLNNFLKVSKNISNEMRELPELTAQANAIEQFTANMSSDYDSYSTEMERGSKIIDAPNFLDTQAEFLDLGNSIKGLTLEDGKTPKYEGTLDYLVKENDKLNSIIGRIDSASKATQFRYNKNSKYTDQEIKEKLMSYQKRLGVAVQTAIGNGEITPEEAEFIMLGDVKTYKESKKNKVDLLKSQYRIIDRAQSTLSTQLQRLQLKGIKDSDAPDLARLFTTEFNAQGSEEVMDTELDGLTIDQMIKDLKEKYKNLNIAKDRTMSSYNAWEGRPMFDAPKATKSETGNLLQNIMVDDGNNINDPLKNLSPEEAKAKAASVDLDVKENAWGTSPLSSYREDYEKGSMSADPNNPLYAIDGVYQYPELFEKKKQKTTKLTYDPAMGDTKVARNKERVKKYKISPQQLGELEEAWSETNKGETFDQFLDNIFRLSDASLDSMWKDMKVDQKSEYRTLHNYKESMKPKE